MPISAETTARAPHAVPRAPTAASLQTAAQEPWIAARVPIRRSVAAPELRTFAVHHPAHRDPAHPPGRCVGQFLMVVAARKAVVPAQPGKPAVAAGYRTFAAPARARQALAVQPPVASLATVAAAQWLAAPARQTKSALAAPARVRVARRARVLKPQRPAVTSVTAAVASSTAANACRRKSAVVEASRANAAEPAPRALAHKPMRHAAPLATAAVASKSAACVLLGRLAAVAVSRTNAEPVRARQNPARLREPNAALSVTVAVTSLAAARARPQQPAAALGFRIIAEPAVAFRSPAHSRRRIVVRLRMVAVGCSTAAPVQAGKSAVVAA